MAKWDDMEEWERLAAKLADAGPTEEHAREWVLEVLAIARADLRAKVEALRDGADGGYADACEAVLALLDGQ